MAIWLLLIAFLKVNLLHGYLLYSQRMNRKHTISEHAADRSSTRILYVLGHVLAGSAFFMFVVVYFFLNYRSLPILIVAIIGIVTEYLQALIPARGKYYSTHEFFAYAMALSVMAIAFIAPVATPLSPILKIICLGIAGVLAVIMCALSVVDRKYFWIGQMVGVQIFYLEMFIIVLAGPLG